MCFAGQTIDAICQISKKFSATLEKILANVDNTKKDSLVPLCAAFSNFIKFSVSKWISNGVEEINVIEIFTSLMGMVLSSIKLHIAVALLSDARIFLSNFADLTQSLLHSLAFCSQNHCDNYIKTCLWPLCFSTTVTEINNCTSKKENVDISALLNHCTVYVNNFFSDKSASLLNEESSELIVNILLQSLIALNDANVIVGLLNTESLFKSFVKYISLLYDCVTSVLTHKLIKTSTFNDKLESKENCSHSLKSLLSARRNKLALLMQLFEKGKDIYEGVTLYFAYVNIF